MGIDSLKQRFFFSLQLDFNFLQKLSRLSDKCVYICMYRHLHAYKRAHTHVYTYTQAHTMTKAWTWS